MVRFYTNKLLDACESGAISYEQVAKACLAYMCEDHVADMVQCDFEELVDEEYEESLDW